MSLLEEFVQMLFRIGELIDCHDVVPYRSAIPGFGGSMPKAVASEIK